MKINHSKFDLTFYYKFIFVLCIPFVIFGLYKNSLMVFVESKRLYLLLKPILSLVLALGLGLFADFKFNKRLRVNRFTISMILLWMILPVVTPLWLYIIGFIFLGFCLLKLDDFVHPIMLAKIVCVIILLIISKYSYQNYYEASGLYVYSFTDLIYKNQVGGLATSNLLLVTIAFINMLFNPLYKKNIAFSSLASYLLLNLGLVIFAGDAKVYLEVMISSSILFEMLFIGTLNEYSSYTSKGQMGYGIVIGIICAIPKTGFLRYEGAAMAILIVSILKKLIDKKFELN